MFHSSNKKKEKNTVKNKVKKQDGKEPKTTVTVNEKSFSTFINAVNDCNEQVMLHIDRDKLSVIQVDIGNVYMIAADCECKATFEDNAPTKVGIDAKLIKKTLLHAKGSSITLTITKSTVELLYGRFIAKLPTVDTAFLRKEPGQEPKMALDTSFEMPGKYLFDVCRMVTPSGGKIYIYVKNKVVFIAANEGDLCMKEVVGTVEKQSKARSLFSNDYLTSIAKSVKDVSVKVDLGIDHPVRIIAEKDGCNLKFLLAPRIEAD